ncbi:MAG TPA: hypothetical protein VKT81_16260 [Bryobacteraceae bacterium]|nr:hypothetical protein [Bryobacteraceae bacterium]
MKTDVRVVLAACLLLAAAQALRIGAADLLFRRDTKNSVERAAEWWPTNAEFAARLADLDPDHAVDHLRRAVFLNPSNSRNWIALGLQLELSGNSGEAEQCYLRAARSDRQYLPAWTLANYYVRRNDAARFWPWAQDAARMSYGDLRPLFRLAFEMSPNPDTVLEKMVAPRSNVEHQFLQELLDRNLDASAVAKRILSRADREDVRPLLSWTNRLIENKRLGEARLLWNALAAKRLIPYPQTALLTNADFSHDPLPQGGFDWRITLPAGVDLGRSSEGLRLEFSGRQPEKFQLLSQSLGVPPGGYRLSFEYRTVDIRGTTNLRWQTGAVSLPPLPVAENWTEWSNTLVADRTTDELALLMDRQPGTLRPEGIVYLRGLKLVRND